MLWASGLTSPCLCFLICNITIPQRCVRSTALTGVSNFVYNKFFKNLSDRELMESIDRIYKSDVEGGKESKIKKHSFPVWVAIWMVVSLKQESDWGN